MKKGARLILTVGMLSVMSAALIGCHRHSDSQVSQTVETIRKEVKEKLTGAEPLEVDSVSGGKYTYETLDDKEKQVYDELVYTFQNRLESAQVATTDEQVLETAYEAVRLDYCEFFWVEKLGYIVYTRGDKVTAIEVTPEYSMSKEKQESYQSQIDAEADRMLEGLPEEGSDFDKALYVYETLINSVDYVVDSEDNQNIISVFVNHETICQGYAYATQYLLEKVGISCSTVTGVANGEPHAWNLVVLDGNYYYMDTTWGNSQYYTVMGDSEEISDTTSKYIDYDYLAMTTEEISRTHQPEINFPLPDCTATEDDYYIHEGRYVTTWNAEAIGNLIGAAYDAGEDMIQIRFADVEMCEQAISYFIEDSRLVDYCDGIEYINYMENADTSVLFLIFDEM